jgi:hypothetical protein
MRLLLICCSIALFIGLMKLPIGYYTFLRIFVTIGAIWVIVKEYDKELSPWVIIFGIIAILFNPLFPIYLKNKTAWLLPDFLSAMCFLIKSFFIHQPKLLK